MARSFPLGIVFICLGLSIGACNKKSNPATETQTKQAPSSNIESAPKDGPVEIDPAKDLDPPQN